MQRLHLLLNRIILLVKFMLVALEVANVIISGLLFHRILLWLRGQVRHEFRVGLLELGHKGFLRCATVLRIGVCWNMRRLRCELTDATIKLTA